MPQVYPVCLVPLCVGEELMSAVVLIIYLLACAVCGFMGRHTTIGFMGHFLLAFIITPILDFLVQLVGRPSRAFPREFDDSRLDK